MRRVLIAMLLLIGCGRAPPAPVATVDAGTSARKFDPEMEAGRLKKDFVGDFPGPDKIRQ